MASALTVLEKENGDGTKTEKKESEDKSVEAKGLVLNSDTQTYWIDEKQAFTFATDDHYRLSAKIEITKNPEVNGIYNISRHVYTPEEEQYIITTQLRYNNGQYFPELVLEKRMQEGIKTKKYSTNEAYKDRQYNLVYYVDIKNFDNNEIEVALNINDKTLYNGDGLQANYTNRDFDAYLPDTNKLNDNVSSDFAYIMYQFGYKYNKYQQDFTMQSAYARPVSASKEVQMNHSVAQTRASIVTMVYNNLVGDKRYELSNHLGNVLEVISDRKLLNIDRGVPVLAPQYNNNESTAPFNKTTQLYKLSVQGEWLVVNNEPGIEKEGAYAPVDLITGHIYQISFVIENGHDGPIEVAVIDDNNDLVFSKVFEGENGFLSYNFQNEAPTGTYNLIFRTYEGGGEYYLKNINLIDVTNVNANQVFGNPAEMAIFVPNVMSYNDYYPFGMLMPTRHESSDGYRYGFNGMEKDDEVKGQGNSYTATFWQYSSRLGKRWNIDPVVNFSESGYATFRNNPILFNDPNGDCPNCKDGTYTIKKGDNFWKLEKAWGMKHGTLQNYNPGIDTKKLSIGQKIKVSPTSVTVDDSVTQTVSINAGTREQPTFTFDEDFPYDPNETPTISDSFSWVYWGDKAEAAAYFTDMDNAVGAYLHYRNGNGADRTFSFEEYINEDSEGANTINNLNNILKSELPKILPYQGQRDFYINPLAAGSSSNLFRYPASENWQKTIGAYYFWITGKVTATEINNKLKYKVTYTLHAIDRYNFNRGAADIATGTPDNVNGRFSTLGWAHSYLHNGIYEREIEFDK